MPADDSLQTTAPGEHGRALLPGEHALKLLADERTVALVRELAHGPARPGELEQRLPSIGRTPMMERLKRLSSGPQPLCERVHGRGREVRYELSEAGYELAQIVAAAARWERATGEHGAPQGNGTPPPASAPASRRSSDGASLALAAAHASAGASALKLIAHEHNRLIGRALVHGALTLAELERTLHGLPHASLARRLQHLQDGGAATALRDTAGHPAYTLTPHGRRLALLVLLASRWEHNWTPEDGRAPADMRALTHMIAPVARLGPGVNGLCRLHVEGQTEEPPVDLAAGTGRISALPLTSNGPFRALAWADGNNWAGALLERDPTHLWIEGDHGLLSGVLLALGSALRA